VFVVMHLRSGRKSMLTEQLQRCTPLPVRVALDGEFVRTGYVYVCPPDRHMALDGGRLRVLLGPTENGYRPAIDVLFRSLARTADSHAVVAVLSGALEDGAAGALEIASAGGHVAVQDPDEAVVGSMPLHALALAPGAVRLAARRIGPWIEATVASAPLTRKGKTIRKPGVIDELGGATRGPASRLMPAPPAGFACPDCGGTLMPTESGSYLSFTCRVGHRWGATGLRQLQDMSLEKALWAARRIVDEQLDLDHRLLKRAEEAGREVAASRLRKRIAERELAASSLGAVMEEIVAPAGGDDTTDLD
jgi:two-component system chemotaxis response regulator CheB